MPDRMTLRDGSVVVLVQSAQVPSDSPRWYVYSDSAGDSETQFLSRHTNGLQALHSSNSYGCPFAWIPLGVIPLPPPSPTIDPNTAEVW